MAAPSPAQPQLKLLPRSQWVPDKKAKNCMQCHKVKFGVNNRRHHCRVCGQVVCQDCSKRRHPTFPEVRVCSRCYSKIIVASNKLHNAAWYHGPLKREACEKRLRQPGTRLGDFLVRESASVDGFIALSVRSQNSVLHYLIKEKFGHWYLGPEPTQANQRNMFPTIQALITEYKAPYNLLRAMIVENHQGDTCPNCAANVNQEMEFCEECGTRLRSTEEQMQVYEDQGQQELVYDGDIQFPNAEGVYDDSKVQNWGSPAPAPAPGMMMAQGYPMQQQQQQQPSGYPMQQQQQPGGYPMQQQQQPMMMQSPPPQMQQQPMMGMGSPAPQSPAGAKLFCHACGSQLKPGSAFCSECGTPTR